MQCTQCGHTNDAGVVICANCDHILDTSFLGEDYLGGAPPLDDEALTGPPTFQGDKTGSFLTAQTSNGTRLLEKEPVPTSAPAVLFERDAVLAIAPGVDISALGLSPFESHVVAFINGERPVARLRTLAGVGAEDLRICLGMLSDRGILVRVATAHDAFDDGQKTGTASLEGLPLDEFGQEPRTDAVLLPDDLLESDDAHLIVPEITPLPVAQPRGHVGAVDLAAVALDFVDEESPMTLEPGASPFAQHAPRSVTPARGIPPPAAVRGGAAPLPPMMPGRGPPAAPAPAPSTPGVRPALRAPGLQVNPPAPAPSAPAPAAPAAPVVRRPPTENQLKARQAYELAMKDIKENKLARALTYARAARDLDPENDLYKDLIANWGKQRQAVQPPNGPKR